MNDSKVELPAVGTIVSKQHTCTLADFTRFAALSRDDNPIHVDADFAAGTRFGRPVAHGMLLYSLLCGLLSQHFPGAVQLDQTFIFPAPTYADVPLTLRAEVLELLADGQARLATTITDPAGEVLAQGETRLAWRNS